MELLTLTMLNALAHFFYFFHSYACHSDRQVVRMLSGTVHRRNVHDTHSKTNAVLWVQPHHSLRSHLLHGAPHVHAAARCRGEDITR